MNKVNAISGSEDKSVALAGASRTNRNYFYATAPIIAISLFLLSLFCLSLFSLCQAGSAGTEIQCYSGQQYTFLAPCGDFVYLWNASAGSNAGVDQCRFLWTAPILDSPQEVTISVLVSNRDLSSCNSIDTINVTVQPRSGCLIAAQEIVCRNSTNNTASTLDAGPGVSYIWTISGGSITSGNDTNSIIWTAEAADLVRIAVLVRSANGSVAECDRMVRVIECEAISITCPPEVTVCADPGRDYATILPAELGADSSNFPQAEISNNAPATNRYPLGESSVIWTAENDAGERASCKQMIRVADCTKPALQLKVTAGAASYSGDGGDMNYTLTLCNNGPVPLSNVLLWDELPAGMELIWVHPEPQNGNIWNIGTLAPGECYVVQLSLRIKDVDLRYDMSQRVRGEGFVNVHANYNSAIGPDTIRNCAYAKADGIPTVSSCWADKVSNPETSLQKRESGSGLYSSEELPLLRALNHSIQSISKLSADYNRTNFSLPSGRSLNHASLWTESSRSRNELTGESISERFSSASKIVVNRSTEQDENRSKSTSEVEFEGMGRISVLKAEALAQSHPVFQSEEDYTGSFKNYEQVESYPSGVLSRRSTTGFGYAAVDRRIGDVQRTYESGTGSYASEEVIETATGYIHKNLSLVHSPLRFVYSPSIQANRSIKWSEGIQSQSGSFEGGSNFDTVRPPLSGSRGSGTLISERYSNLDRLEKDSTAFSLKDMKTRASFSGQADYRVRYADRNGSDQVDSIESYSGSYEVQRDLVISENARYDVPHLTVSVEGGIEEAAGNGIPRVGRYNITLINDGSSSLAPVQLTDIFPAGAEYIRSTMRPTTLLPGQANWTVQSLGSGNSITIILELNLTAAALGDVVNRVHACGGYDQDRVCTSEYLVLGQQSLSCCLPQMLVSKKGTPDASDPAMVKYEILLTNNGQDSVAVNVTDELPGGMDLLYASIYPHRMEKDRMIWIIPEVKPGESKRIEYTTLASRDGEFISTVHIEATSINGTGYDTSDAVAYVLINRTGVDPRSFRYGEWEPPAWKLNQSEESFDDIIDSFIDVA